MSVKWQMHAIFELSVSYLLIQILECLVNLSGSFMVRSPPGTPTIISKSTLLSCWYVKHPIINYTSPIPLRLVKVVKLIDDRLPRLFENENEGGAESDWLSWEPCIACFDLPETRLNDSSWQTEPRKESLYPSLQGSFLTTEKYLFRLFFRSD